MFHHTAISVVLFTVFGFSTIRINNNIAANKFEILKQKALVAGKVGHAYVYNLTGMEGCNKSCIRYLGIATTSKGKKYKVLTAFYVFRTSGSNCHGASAIEIYTLENKIVGKYRVGMPDDLPDKLKDNKLIYLTNSEDCDLRKKRSIDLSHGLPKSFFIECSEKGGDIYTFSAGD